MLATPRKPLRPTRGEAPVSRRRLRIPLNYPVEFVTVGNGLGYLTPRPGLGLPAGSSFYHRLGRIPGGQLEMEEKFYAELWSALCARDRAAAIVIILPFRSSML